MANKLLAGVYRMISGLGYKVSLDPGNAGNPPSNPPVEAGNYQFIQPFAFQGNGHFMTDISPVPPQYADWGQYPVNGGDQSGFFGGGTATGQQVDMPTEQDLYYDTSSGLYYNIDSSFGG